MAKPSIPRGDSRRPMFKETDLRTIGPSEGEYIHLAGKGEFRIRHTCMVFDPNMKHTSYKMIVQDDEGQNIATQLPAEVLQFTGWSWADSNIPFDLSITRERRDWHLVDVDSQMEVDVECSTGSIAVAQLVSSTAGIGDVVIVHPVFRFSLLPSGARWIAGIRRLVNKGGSASGPLRDCFTHPDSSACALGPFRNFTRRNAIQFKQDLNDLFLRYFPDGIEWPGIGDGELYCTHCFTALSDCGCGGESNFGSVQDSL
jgi:hypothetical protein